MAWSQTEASDHMKGLGNVAIEDGDGLWYIPLGPIRCYFGSGGAPTGWSTDYPPIGSFAWDLATGSKVLYLATDAAGTFAEIGDVT